MWQSLLFSQLIKNNFLNRCRIAYQIHSDNVKDARRQLQPPPQALRFSHRRGERETRVTGDEPQGTMGRVQTSLSPSRLPLRAHFLRERDVWVRGRDNLACSAIRNDKFILKKRQHWQGLPSKIRRTGEMTLILIFSNISIAEIFQIQWYLSSLRILKAVMKFIEVYQTMKKATNLSK